MLQNPPPNQTRRSIRAQEAVTQDPEIYALISEEKERFKEYKRREERKGGRTSAPDQRDGRREDDDKVRDLRHKTTSLSTTSDFPGDESELDQVGARPRIRTNMKHLHRVKSVADATSAAREALVAEPLRASSVTPEQQANRKAYRVRQWKELPTVGENGDARREVPKPTQPRSVSSFLHTLTQEQGNGNSADGVEELKRALEIMALERDRLKKEIVQYRDRVKDLESAKSNSTETMEEVERTHRERLEYLEKESQVLNAALHRTDKERQYMQKELNKHEERLLSEASRLESRETELEAKYQSQVDENKEIQVRMLAMEKTHLDQLEKVVNRSDVEKHRLKAQMDHAMENLSHKHAKGVQNLNIEKRDIMQKLEQELQASRQEMRKVKDEMDARRSQSLEEKAAQKEQHDSKWKTHLDEACKAKEAEIRRLHIQHQDELAINEDEKAKLGDRAARDLVVMREGIEATIRALRANQREEMDMMVQKLEKRHRNELERSLNGLRKSKIQLEKELMGYNKQTSDAMTRLRSEHDQEMEMMEIRMEEAKQSSREMLARCAEEIERLKIGSTSRPMSII